MNKPAALTAVVLVLLIGTATIWNRSAVRNRDKDVALSALAPKSGPTRASAVAEDADGYASRERIPTASDVSTLNAVGSTTDRSVINAINLTASICSEPVPPEDPAWNDPQRRWALDRIAATCAAFQPHRVAYTGDYMPAGEVAITRGETAAVEAATAEIVKQESTIDLIDSATFLISRGQFPGQAQYNLDEEKLMRAAGFAAGLRTCKSFAGCGSDSIMTAEICARNGCPPGTSYSEAMRSVLAPKEYETGLSIAQQLAKASR